MQMPSYPGCEGASYSQIMHDFRGICVLRNNVLDNEERSPRANFQLSISGKAPLLLLPGGVGVNLCSLQLYVASIQAARNCAWERESE